MRWLHLSDLHVGRVHDGQTVALRSLTSSILESVGDSPFDYIIATGDIAHSGLADQYKTFGDLVLAPLRQAPQFSSSILCAVPGNHDVDCSTALPLAWESLGANRQRIFFDNSPEGAAIRRPRASGFTAFGAFCSSQGALGLDPCANVSDVHVLNRGSTRVALITVNTALFSDKEVSDKNKTPAPTQAIRSRLNEVTEETTKIIVGHHPVEWFTHATQKLLNTLLYDEPAIYIHGHSHKILVDTTNRGLRTLGLGAAYQAPLDAPNPSFYENTYAVCALESDLSLHVAFHSWDAEHGKWRRSNRLPPEFSEPSEVIAGGWRFDLPRKSATTRRAKSGVVARRHTPPRVEAIVAAAPLTGADWISLLALLRVVPAGVSAVVDEAAQSPGQFEINYDDSSGRHCIRCIGGPGHILSERAVEAANTRLDKEQLASFTICSLGTVAQDARLLALQLQRHKDISVRDTSDLAALVSAQLSGPLGSHIDSLNAPDVKVAYLVLPGEIGLLVADALKENWFYALDHSASVLPESHAVIRRLRDRRPEFSLADYQPPDGVTPPEPAGVVRDDFDRLLYLKLCQAEFESLKYAPLAAVGVRFPNAKLHDVYVPARAEVGDGTAESAAYSQAINDLLDSLQLDDAQRLQMEARIREVAPKAFLRDTGAARSLYQQHDAVLIAGDPGSGKTCFAKHEILTYCSPSAEDEWYGFHTPIYVSLAEAASLFADGFELLNAAAVLTARRGLPLSGPQLSALLSRGRVAFFFDGLDEVASVEHRARLMEAIGSLVMNNASLGNRFVVTSRPAVLEPLEVPKALTTLHLRGLIEDEMRLLVTNLLRAEVAPGGDQLRFSDLEIKPSQDALVNQLIADCQANPGIRRIARNPLLLTLLVMIYVNSGPLAAKRHRVYAQAIQTLVSVRNRETGQAVLSEADLRRRLGFAALAHFESNQADIPSRAVFVELVKQALEREGRDGDLSLEAESFIQRVAEATGLLVFHVRPSDGTSRVGFLHHSFYEYYVALGFLEEDDTAGVANLAQHARWREVLTLMAGIIGDRADITPFVRQLLSNASKVDVVTGDRVLFAVDCVLECDVPPEEAQRTIADSAKLAIEEGPGLGDPGFRREIGDRLGRLLAGSGSPYVRAMLARGIASARAAMAAAYVDVAGFAGKLAPLGAEVIEAYDATARREDNAIRLSVFGAMERTPELRTEAAIAAMKAGLKGSAAVRYTAARAAEAVPGIVSRCELELRACLSDTQPLVAGMAARALLHSGIALSTTGDSGKHFLELCLKKWERTASISEPSLVRLTANRREVDLLLSSPIVDERVLGLRILPWLEKEELYVHDRLMETLTPEHSREENVAALASLRLCKGSLALTTAAETDRILQMLNAPHRDIRVAAMRALQAFALDSGAIEKIAIYSELADPRELRESLAVLVDKSAAYPRARSFIVDRATQLLRDTAKGNVGNELKQQETLRFLSASRELSGEAPAGLVSTVESILGSYKVPKRIRQQALRTYAKLVVPSAESVSRFVGLLNTADPMIGVVLGPAVADFVKRCRQRVGYVRAVYPFLQQLEDAIVERWFRPSATESTRIHSDNLIGLRDALKETRELKAGYTEFA